MTILSWIALLPLLLLAGLGFGAHSLGGLDEKLFLAGELLWLTLACAHIVLEARGGAPKPMPSHR